MNDPDGAPWEVYTVLADAPAESGIAGDGTCCLPDTGQVFLSLAESRRAATCATSAARTGPT